MTVLTNPAGQSCSVSGGSGTVASANVSGISVACMAAAERGGNDNFARPNGSLGSNWTAMSVGALAIANEQVIGTNANGNSGDIRTAETYGSDQYSQTLVSSTPLTGTQWIGPVVRAQAGGQDAYVGIYYWDNGSPDLMLFLRDNGAWTVLGSYSTSPLAAGTQLTLTVVGSSLTFSDNGTTVISATNSTLTGGDPGIMANGTATAGNWARRQCQRDILQRWERRDIVWWQRWWSALGREHSNVLSGWHGVRGSPGRSSSRTTTPATSR